MPTRALSEDRKYCFMRLHGWGSSYFPSHPIRKVLLFCAHCRSWCVNGVYVCCHGSPAPVGQGCLPVQICSWRDACQNLPGNFPSWIHTKGLEGSRLHLEERQDEIWLTWTMKLKGSDPLWSDNVAVCHFSTLGTTVYREGARINAAKILMTIRTEAFVDF